ncbi:B3 domain-containing transcription factor NGA4 [Raphanus sativus]|uniref:B3 domain-containing transcription factor NGA4 n=1 Tax=Raphanus sativus TaxID=3726 RepID=A0A6J0L6N4_RAPSA|nr:B3 domain-containing transcription factor NGA4 [Raphanus sativus]KAJ4876657.1 B3 domain-containing transcription factor NGA4 [Raphanus sativus]
MASGSGNNNNFNLGMGEHMFDKVLTPSDVGKLNRLVIPKHHAESYFPLEDNQNGTVLEFQDRNGKMWRFRYLFWSSSQSYVMTKGWIRFVKDKNLENGDTISFHRGYVEDENEPEKRTKKLFVDWRHRADRNLVHNINHHHHYPLFMSPTYPSADYYPLSEYSMPHYRRFPPFYHNQLQERDFLGYGYGGPYYAGAPLDHNHHYQYGRSEPLVYNSYPVYPTTRVPSSAAMVPPPQEGTAKKVRLFGVDVEESASSGEARGEMGVAGYSSSSPVVIRDEESSSVMQLSDDEEYKRKGKSIDF